MKYVCLGSLAALLATGIVSYPNAAPAPRSFEALSEGVAPVELTPAPYDHCHGLSSGTADARCRPTRTGGPVGGLF